MVEDLVGKECQMLSEENLKRIMARKTRSDESISRQSGETPSTEVQLAWMPSDIRYTSNLRASSYYNPGTREV